VGGELSSVVGGGVWWKKHLGEKKTVKVPETDHGKRVENAKKCREKTNDQLELRVDGRLQELAVKMAKKLAFGPQRSQKGGETDR